MKVLAALLCALLAAPVRGQDLQLYLIANTPAHVEAWNVVRAAVRLMGLGAQAHPLPAERGMLMVSRGELDGAIGRTTLAAHDYPDLVMVAEPVFHYAPTAYAYRTFDVSKGWHSLRGHTLCVRRGYTLTDKRTRGIPVQRFNDDPSLLKMLQRGGCNIALLDRRNPAAQAAMASEPRLLQLLPPLEEMPLYLFLHKRHAALAPRLAEALKQVKAQ